MLDSRHGALDTVKWRRILGVGLCGLLVYYAAVPFTNRILFSIIFYAVISIISLLKVATSEKPLLPFTSSRWLNLFVIGLYILAGTFQAVYYYAFFRQLSYQWLGMYPFLAYLLAVFNLLICIHMTWYLTGLTVPLICVIGFLYAAFGFLVPGPFFHTGFSIKEMLEYFSLLMLEGGVYGIPLQTAVTLVAIFVLFSGLGQVSGLLETFLKLSWRLAAREKRFVPQFSVLSSMALSTITGSAMANVAATGVFTIPLMKKFGIRPKVAGAVEVVASSGGQVMPPVMGTVAFLMVEFLGVSYLRIMEAALPVALLLYTGIVIGVHLTAGYEVGLPVSGLAADGQGKTYETPMSRADWFNLGTFSSAVLVLILAYSMYNLPIMVGGLLAIIWYTGFELIYIITTGFRKEGARAFLSWLKILYEGCWKTAEGLFTIVFVCGSIGIVIKILYATGASQVMATYMSKFAGGQFIPLLLLSWMLGVALGMIASSAAVYILVVIIVAPGLVAFGIPPLVSHFYVFLLAMTSPVTPPFGGGVIVASGLSGASVMRVGLSACKLGVVYFLLPFVVIAHPEILNFNMDALAVFPLLLVSMATLAFAVNLPHPRRLDYPLQFVLAAAAAASALIRGGPYLWLSLAVLVVVTVVLVLRHRESLAISLRRPNSVPV